MNSISFIILLYLFVAQIFSATLKEFSMEVKNLKLTKCNNKLDYNVTVTDVSIHQIINKRIEVSGSLSSKIDLKAPISAKVWVERDILGVWIPIPCEKNLGCCTYTDLCQYGIPMNKTCPAKFQENNVPCRCPIAKGNYTIKPAIQLSEETSIITGSYKGIISVMQAKSVISCYNFNFDLVDGVPKSKIKLQQV